MTRRKPFLRSCVPAFLRLNNTRHYNQKTRNEWVRKDFGLKVCSLTKICVTLQTKVYVKMAQLKEFTQGRNPVTFVDLFAGAGGISEGFMQAYTDDKYYDFVLASDINENCELTHRVRYNEQLGLDTKFITEDIMSPTFLKHLIKELNGESLL